MKRFNRPGLEGYQCHPSLSTRTSTDAEVDLAVIAARMARMTEVRTAHTADLDAATLRAARALLYDVFDDMTDDDWEHALGGVHALVWEGAELIGHASVIQRRLLHGGQALRTGYVEGVGVRADRRGRGHGAAMMQALERVVRGAYDMGALGATDEAAGFYAARGWQLWQGPSSALTPTGVKRTAEDDGGIYVLPLQVPLDLSGELTCDWRDGDVW
jgi:aminoglycoside 2'-N-acetyltransferase I